MLYLKQYIKHRQIIGTHSNNNYGMMATYGNYLYYATGEGLNLTTHEVDNDWANITWGLMVR